MYRYSSSIPAATTETPPKSLLASDLRRLPIIEPPHVAAGDSHMARQPMVQPASRAKEIVNAAVPSRRSDANSTFNSGTARKTAIATAARRAEKRLSPAPTPEPPAAVVALRAYDNTPLGQQDPTAMDTSYDRSSMAPPLNTPLAVQQKRAGNIPLA